MVPILVTGHEDSADGKHAKQTQSFPFNPTWSNWMKIAIECQAAHAAVHVTNGGTKCFRKHSSVTSKQRSWEPLFKILRTRIQIRIN
jgi:hypothetical protein